MEHKVGNKLIHHMIFEDKNQVNHIMLKTTKGKHKHNEIHEEPNGKPANR
jgi:hypothetical protein